MHGAALVFCFRKDLGYRFAHPQTLVPHQQLNSVKAPLLQPDQEIPPAFTVLLHSFRGADDLTIAVLIHADGHQNADVLEFSAPVALEVDTVDVDGWILPGERTVAPFFDMDVGFLIQIADGGSPTRGCPRALR